MKRKMPERPEDCKTLLQKIAFSNMVRELWESIPYDAPPSAIGDLLDKFPYNPDYPWSHPEWSAYYARTEIQKQREQRRMIKQQPRDTRKGKS
jgi:hypothetical protein